MTLTIEPTPQDEHRLCAAARMQGMHPTELARKLVLENLPTVSATEPNGTLCEDPTSALLTGWIEEGENASPEEIADAQKEWEEFKNAINETRKEAGMRLLYP